MTDVNEPIERLIVRRLDGALNAEEELQLDRELLRNPSARQLMDEYRRIDECASGALHATFSQEVSAPSPLTLVRPVPTRRAVSYHRGWWLVPGAIAAALLALAIPRATLEPARTPAPRVVMNHPSEPMESGPPNLPSIAMPSGTAIQPYMRTVGSVPSVRRSTDRDVIGILGDDGNLYFIEVNRTWTIKRPQTPRSEPWSNGDI